jgi:hypothetical protein
VKIPVKKTSRKFYRKWLYKVSFNLPGCSIFRDNRYDLTEDQIEFINHQWFRIDHWRETEQRTRTADLSKMSALLCRFDRKEWQYRIEYTCFDVYTSNREMYQALISSELADKISECHEPDVDSIKILDDPNNQIVTDYPHGRYRFKVFLNPTKLSGSVSAREDVANWLLAQNPKIHCTETVADWFETARSGSSLRYVLVDDDATLLLLKLRAGGAVTRIYNYIKV